jgi:hypothetical protein
MPRKLKATATSITIHPADRPFDTEGAVVLTMVDEGGGAFFELSDVESASPPLRIELDELECVLKAARRMLKSAESPRSQADATSS